MNEEVSRDMTGEADGKNPGVDSTDGAMHIRLVKQYFRKSNLHLITVSFRLLPLV